MTDVIMASLFKIDLLQQIDENVLQNIFVNLICNLKVTLHPILITFIYTYKMAK